MQSISRAFTVNMYNPLLKNKIKSGYTLRKGENSIAGYAMKWKALSQIGRRVGRPRTMWHRVVEEKWLLLGKSWRDE